MSTLPRLGASYLKPASCYWLIFSCIISLYCVKVYFLTGEYTFNKSNHSAPFCLAFENTQILRSTFSVINRFKFQFYSIKERPANYSLYDLSPFTVVIKWLPSIAYYIKEKFGKKTWKMSFRFPELYKLGCWKEMKFFSLKCDLN